MTIKGIHHIALHTRDLDRMAMFYRAAFGFEPAAEEYRWQDNPRIDQTIDVADSAARSLMMAAGNVYVELFEFARPAPANTSPLRPSDRGYTHFAVETDDLAADYERLLKAGMTFPHGPAQGANALYGRDPDGNIIEVKQAAAGRLLAMDSLPLLTST